MIQREEHIGNQRLILGDCLQVMPLLGKVDAVVTDPPYGIGFPYNSHEDSPENLQSLVDGLMPIARANSSRIVITPGNTNVFRYPPADWIGAWTWDTTTACGFWGWSQWQPILLYGDDVWPGTNSKGGPLKSDRIHFSGGEAKISHDLGQGHTCPKPLAFMVKMIGRFTLDDETVLDPFLGSGTTGVACVNLGRSFIGIELDPDYFDIAVKRITDAHRQADLFVDKPAPVKWVQEGLLCPPQRQAFFIAHG
jgi:DNA modification methylase